MKAHAWEWLSMDDPATLKINMGYRCRACKSEIKASIDVLGTPQATADAMHDVRMDLEHRRDQTFSPDCEEEIRLKVCRHIHDS